MKQLTPGKHLTQASALLHDAKLHLSLLSNAALPRDSKVHLLRCSVLPFELKACVSSPCVPCTDVHSRRDSHSFGDYAQQLSNAIIQVMMLLQAGLHDM